MKNPMHIDLYSNLVRQLEAWRRGYEQANAISREQVLAAHMAIVAVRSAIAGVRGLVDAPPHSAKQLNRRERLGTYVDDVMSLAAIRKRHARRITIRSVDLPDDAVPGDGVLGCYYHNPEHAVIRVSCTECDASNLLVLIHEVTHAAIAPEQGHSPLFNAMEFNAVCQAMRWTRPHPLRLTHDEIALIEGELERLGQVLGAAALRCDKN